MQELFPEYPVLVVDDEPLVLEGLEMALCSEGFNNLRLEGDPRKVVNLLERETYEAVLLDIHMPGLSGDNLLIRIKERRPDIPVIMVTGVDDVKMAVSCIRKGAYDYLLKPVRNEDLAACLCRALETSRLRRENTRLTEKLLSGHLDHPEVFADLITRDPAMLNLFRYCEAVASSQEPILITGETGTGKELMARAAHALSGRTGEFVALNIAALDDQAFSDTLFGHVRGAFTGAERPRSGFLEKAAGGTLFLDEIGDMSLASQIRLLRVLQEREFFPLGSDVAKPLKARLVVATNRDLAHLRNPALFRPDFYFRIKTHHIHLPPLRERKQDLPLLIDFFLNQAAKGGDKASPLLPPSLLEKLSRYAFPGNIRELRALVFDMVAAAEGNILDPEKLTWTDSNGPAEVFQENKQDVFPDLLRNLNRLPTLKEAGRILIEEALRRSKGNQREASSLLGITPQALSSRLKQLKGQ
ncbi:MAG: sigma-54 dependent transcriptional regulator [Syntrophotaleaceae bacterium]